MYSLIFDTETTSLTHPRIVQLAWQVYDDDELVSQHNHLIQPSGFVIPAEATAIHGITTEEAYEKGDCREEVIEFFVDDLNTLIRQDGVIVAHNMDFDKHVINTEANYGVDPNYCDPIIDGNHNNLVCTMKLSTDFCRIPAKQYGRYKWPTLTELHRKLFHCDFEGAHNALADVKACYKCYKALLNRGIIRL